MGWSAGRHVDYPCGGGGKFRHGLLEKTMKRFESHSQQFVSQQQEAYAHKQHTQFQKFDGGIRDKDEVIQSLRQELANNQERHLQNLPRKSKQPRKGRTG